MLDFWGEGTGIVGLDGGRGGGGRLCALGGGFEGGGGRGCRSSSLLKCSMSWTACTREPCSLLALFKARISLLGLSE